MSNRIEYRTSDLINDGLLEIGDGYRAKNIELGSLGLPFARVSNINNGFHFEDADRFPQENLHKVGAKVGVPGDVVFTSKGTVGRFAFVPDSLESFVYSPQLCYWRSLDWDAIDPRFLYYWMHGREFWVQVHGTKGQTDMADYVSLRDQRRMSITLPDIKEQKAIAAVLGAFDDKIELNRQMNATLEEMARAIFKSWFVDFDPVHAKARGEQPTGMDAETAPLFPDRFEVVDGREVPIGWQVASVSEAFEINPPRKLCKGEPAPYLAMTNAPTASARATNWELREFGSGMRFMNGDALLARITPCLENGKCLFVDFLEDSEIGWGSTEFLVFRSKPPLPLEFAYVLMRVDNFRLFAVGNMTGTSGRQRVPKQAFDNYQIVVPAEQIASNYGAFVGKVFDKMKANDDESRTLSELRDTLLPNLMSGKLRV